MPPLLWYSVSLMLAVALPSVASCGGILRHCRYRPLSLSEATRVGEAAAAVDACRTAGSAVRRAEERRVLGEADGAAVELSRIRLKVR